MKNIVLELAYGGNKCFGANQECNLSSRTLIKLIFNQYGVSRTVAEGGFKKFV
jgi:hypothetical protein